MEKNWGDMPSATLIVKYDYEAKENKLDVQSHVTAFLVQNT